MCCRCWTSRPRSSAAWKAPSTTFHRSAGSTRGPWAPSWLHYVFIFIPETAARSPRSKNQLHCLRLHGHSVGLLFTGRALMWWKHTQYVIMYACSLADVLRSVDDALLTASCSRPEFLSGECCTYRIPKHAKEIKWRSKLTMISGSRAEICIYSFSPCILHTWALLYVNMYVLCWGYEP